MSAKPHDWEYDQKHGIDHYFATECKRGREWIFKVNEGTDINLAIAKFATENNIDFARIHTSFMGGLQPAHVARWTPPLPGSDHPWRGDIEVIINEPGMIMSMQGFIHKVVKEGKEVPLVSIHFVYGGHTAVPIYGGHLSIGSLSKGTTEFFITEILGIKQVYEVGYVEGHTEPWYEEV